jgi:uncharacterized damage-inducible protein DinB
MPISDALLSEFDHEMATTRRAMERVPSDKLSWKPHDKSMPLGRLTGHIAEMPGWAVPTIGETSLDIAPVGSAPYQPPTFTSTDEILAQFDRNVAAARAMIAGASDEHLMQPWSLLAGGKTIFTMPRAGVLRTMVMNHIIHHRGQLSVYLRLNEIPVPSIYGPSADEGSM